jgi:transcriptional regulator with XRE-family HTH domain
MVLSTSDRRFEMASQLRKAKGRRSISEIEIDRHIGQRVRERRIILGLSQTVLAEGLGISFQQLQKYETGFNRIGAGRLYGCAELLGVRPEYFFEGLEGSDSGTPDETRSDEALKLARAHYSIDDPAQRQYVRKLVQAIARSDT